MINVNAKITILKWNHIDNGNKTKRKQHKMMENKQIKQTNEEENEDDNNNNNKGDNKSI